MQLLREYFEELFDPKDSLQNGRQKAWDRLQQIGLPRPRQEDFQYLHLKDLCFPRPADFPATREASSSDLLFIDGHFQPASLPSPLICLPLDEAMRTYGLFLQNRSTRLLKEESDPFAALNGALQGKGAFLYIPPHCRLERPLEITHLLSGSNMASPRLHIYLNKGAKVSLLQKTTSAMGAFCNALIDIVLEEGAELELQETLHLNSSTRYFQAVRASLKKEAQLKILSFSKGALSARQSIKVQLLEEGAEAILEGLAGLNSSLEHHTHIVMEHIAPRCRSRQHFKTLLQDSARSSFEGKILVRSTAQKTESYQLNNNLLLSDEAWAYSKPNLEIFASDVKASHGSTIAQLDPEERFYLMSRGLSKKEADAWLIRGFSHEILQKAHPSLRGSL